MTRRPLPVPKKPTEEPAIFIQRKSSKRGLDIDRCFAIETTIKKYDPEFDTVEFRAALVWAYERIKKSSRDLPIDERFSDPLLMVAELIKSKADRTTIMAAILYPAARPIKDGRGLNQECLDEIEKKFKDGKKIAKLVKRTLHFRALNLPLTTASAFEDENAKPEKKEKAKENIRLFRLMSLWAAHDPRAILIGATQLTLHLQGEDDNKGFFDSETLKRLLINAKHVYSDLTYIAGYSKVRKKLMNLYYRISDPQGIADAWAKSTAKFNPDNGAEIESMIAHRLEDELRWIRGVHFNVEFRLKDGVSCYEKSRRQNKPIEELADIYGARIMVEFPGIRWAGDPDIDKLSPTDREWALNAFGQIEEDRVYGTLSGTHGRNNKQHTHYRIDPKTAKKVFYSPIQERFAELALTEPRDKDPVKLENPERFEKEKALYPHIHDSRFEGCVKLPKASGMSLIKDMFIFFLRGRAYEVEIQILDPIRHDTNANGPRSGHFSYKADLIKHGDSIEAWRSAVAIEFDGVMNRNKRTYVFDNGGNVYDLSKKPQVHEFIEAAGLTGKCNEVSVTSIFGEREPGVTRGPGSVLTNGCMITPLKLAR